MNDVLVNKHNKGVGWVNPHVTTTARLPYLLERPTARHDAHVGIGNGLATRVSKSRDPTAGAKLRERAASVMSVGAVDASSQNTGPYLSKKITKSERKIRDVVEKRDGNSQSQK